MREAAYDWELGSGLEQAVLQLPEDYRLVLILHDVEEMSTNETVSAATSVVRTSKSGYIARALRCEGTSTREPAQARFRPSSFTLSAATE
jgi:DNA-directed RNA polymerase specialized sigma24 family protein